MACFYFSNEPSLDTHTFIPPQPVPHDMKQPSRSVASTPEGFNALMKAFHVSRAAAKMETLQAIGPQQMWLAESALEDEVTGL